MQQFLDSSEDARRPLWPSLADVAATLGTRPGSLVALADGVAATTRKAVGPSGPRAFLVGLSFGVILARRAGGKRAVRPIDAAVERVASLGRYRVIAQHCDLAAIAHAEQVGACLVTGTLSFDRQHHDGSATLFESGLAVALSAFAS